MDRSDTTYLTVPMKSETKEALQKAAAENGRATGREAEKLIESGLAARLAAEDVRGAGERRN